VYLREAIGGVEVTGGEDRHDSDKQERTLRASKSERGRENDQRTLKRERSENVEERTLRYGRKDHLNTYFMSFYSV
jgi:hypothetical protein